MGFDENSKGEIHAHPYPPVLDPVFPYDRSEARLENLAPQPGIDGPQYNIAMMDNFEQQKMMQLDNSRFRNRADPNGNGILMYTQPVYMVQQPQQMIYPGNMHQPMQQPMQYAPYGMQNGPPIGQF
jgi:hypothetical protein